MATAGVKAGEICPDIFKAGCTGERFGESCPDDPNDEVAAVSIATGFGDCGCGSVVPFVLSFNDFAFESRLNFPTFAGDDERFSGTAVGIGLNVPLPLW